MRAAGLNRGFLSYRSPAGTFTATMDPRRDTERNTGHVSGRAAPASSSPASFAWSVLSPPLEYASLLISAITQSLSSTSFASGLRAKGAKGQREASACILCESKPRGHAQRRAAAAHHCLVMRW